MLLAIDIGNTNIAFGVFDGETLRATWNVATDINKTADEYAVLLLNLLPREGLAPTDIDHVSIACVVPPLLTIFEELSQRYFKIPPLIVGPGVKTGVSICTDNPREVGADRVANAAAAHHLYGGPLIVIDFGTATTLDALSKEGDYLGGAIAPGIGIAAEALFERASKLPRVELIPPEHAIGKNTVTTMQSGIIFGYVGLIEGLVTRIKQELGGEAYVVATGGLAEVIATETKVIDTVDMHLTLIGLRLIHELNR
ncbi:MAG: type III pantothenate kinase [Dehalococcoidia bacterium]|nr:MAG: type III pantothenate kinase [Dehalococcoidia bacterium]